MIKNYLKIAWRNISKHKIFSLINIISLSIGLSAALVIGMMVYYDFTFDKFHPDGDRIYRVTSKFSNPESTSFNPGVPIPLVDAVKNEVAGIETAAFFHQFKLVNVGLPQSKTEFKEQDFVVFADQKYFDLFNYKWLAGSRQHPLSNPNEVVLTDSRAKLYFPNLVPSQILGQTLTYNDSTPAVVTGIVADFKERTDIVFQEFLSLKTAPQTALNNRINNTSWHSTWGTSQLWVKLKGGTLVSGFQGQLNELALEHGDKESVKFGATREFYAQPLSNLHFNDDFGIYDINKAVADKDVLIMLSLVALFLLLLGCANFINLNTAQATQRAKEIGIRKTLGGSKRQLISQFLGETFLLTLIAGIISLFLSVWLIKIFDDFIADGISLTLLQNPYLLGFVGVLLILVTLLAGFYPGVVLSKFRPARVLKGQNIAVGGKSGLRQFLTVFQFTIAFIFIISTFLVGKQINYLINKDMGFKTESLASIQTPRKDETVENRKLLVQKLKTISQLEKVSMGGPPPASFDNSSTSFINKEGTVETQTSVKLLFGDSEYLDLYNIPLLKGRLPLNDTIREAVINLKAVEKMGFKKAEDAINKTVTSGGTPYLISGVMADFNQGSLKGEIEPMAFVGDIWRAYSTGFDVIHFSLPAGSSKNLSAILAEVENKYKEVYPADDMELQFIDETILEFYNKERSMSKLLDWAMGLSVLISCLGLLGLVIYTTERRVKEIGIRKVLGASIVQLNALLCKDFVVLILIAFAIAIPVAYWLLNDWLQDFANRTELSWWIFAGSGMVIILLALVIMSIKTIATAMQNPVKSLRTE
ncbi:ABC-type antimicrobial peptide transport system permease subunit [Gillisia sp. Hel_I_86]|uniref:ABC transporter permease n=1 Tax=Gillisia sp. Hel_I_86 TaxID=1249981 RepID=UPI00119AEC84|nr:FtsX-like permease family protein [Gillisia sp. Hel_I_86]TVZ25840.1 ABC-type antimicrobial peptide transport system permease subunit [Gillisia sp. Hel_I_86]